MPKRARFCEPRADAGRRIHARDEPMSIDTNANQSTAQHDEYGTGPAPDAVITFGDDTHEGFVALVESLLARSAFIRTERGPMPVEHGETELLLDEVDTNGW